MAGKVLSIGKSDSSGAGGLQADIKTVSALGGYAMTAAAAVGAQNTKGVAHIEAMEPWFVEQQMRVALEDPSLGMEEGDGAIKTGTLVNAGIIEAVAGVLDQYRDADIPVVVDPAILVRSASASMREQIMDEETIAQLKRRLFVRATVLTPSLREAELLTGMKIRDRSDMSRAADMMRTLGAEAVLLKAGTVALAGGEKTLYLLASDSGEKTYEMPALDATRTLGLGSTLASAVAISLAQGMELPFAAQRGISFLHGAAAHIQGGEKGAKPLDHCFALENAALSKAAKA